MLFLIVNLLLGLGAIVLSVLATGRCARTGRQWGVAGKRSRLDDATQLLWLGSASCAVFGLFLHSTPFNGPSLLWLIGFAVTGFLPLIVLRLSEAEKKIDGHVSDVCGK